VLLYSATNSLAKYSPHELADFVLDRLRKVALAA